MSATEEKAYPALERTRSGAIASSTARFRQSEGPARRFLLNEFTDLLHAEPEIGQVTAGEVEEDATCLGLKA